MSIVLVDNNTGDLSSLADQVTTLFPKLQIEAFTDPLMSAKYICNHDVAVVFLAAEMRPVDGLILLRTLRANKPTLPVVLLLESAAQREAMLCEPANSCLVKPVSTTSLKNTVKQIMM